MRPENLVLQSSLEGDAGHVLGGMGAGAQGAEPHGEVGPYVVTTKECQCLQDAERDGGNVDEALVGFDLAKDEATEVGGFSVQVEIAWAGPGAWHGHHPEVVGEAQDDVDELLELDFDLESQTVGLDDRLGLERAVSGDEDT